MQRRVTLPFAAILVAIFAGGVSCTKPTAEPVKEDASAQNPMVSPPRGLSTTVRVKVEGPVTTNDNAVSLLVFPPSGAKATVTPKEHPFTSAGLYYFDVTVNTPGKYSFQSLEERNGELTVSDPTKASRADFQKQIPNIGAMGAQNPIVVLPGDFQLDVQRDVKVVVRNESPRSGEVELRITRPTSLQKWDVVPPTTRKFSPSDFGTGDIEFIFKVTAKNRTGSITFQTREKRGLFDSYSDKVTNNVIPKPMGGGKPDGTEPGNR